MRIITGKIKGRQLFSPPVGEKEIRPTSDRAREALFSILSQHPSGAFLDLFSGTGAVAVEAWSRGYNPVYAVEKSRNAFALIKKNLKDTDIIAYQKDAMKLNASDFHGLDIVFADPPYEIGRETFVTLAPIAKEWMNPNGLLIWETDGQTELETIKGWVKIDSRRYGACCFHFFQVG